MKNVIDDFKEYIYGMKKWQVIVIVSLFFTTPIFVGLYVYVTYNISMMNEQKNQEKLQEIKATTDISDKYQSALQAKNQKDWNKVIILLNTIDMDMVKKNVEAFKAKHEINSEKELKAAIIEKKRNESIFKTDKEKENIEAQYNELLKTKPITISQISILKRFAEGMIEFQNGNYKKADDIFSSTQDIAESDIADEFINISTETRNKLTVQVPVKVIDATCIMKFDNTFWKKIPYFTIIIENPLDEPVYVSDLVVGAIDKNGERAYYVRPEKNTDRINCSLDIPAKSKAVYKCRASLFLDDIKYYLLGVDDFFMKNNQKRFTECEKYTAAKIYKVEAKY